MSSTFVLAPILAEILARYVAIGDPAPRDGSLYGGVPKVPQER